LKEKVVDAYGWEVKKYKPLTTDICDFDAFLLLKRR